MNYLVSGNVPKRIGNAHANIVPYQVFPLRTATSLSRPATTTSTEVLQRHRGPELAQNPAYKDNVGRLKHREELVGELTSITARMKRDDCSTSSRHSKCRPVPSTIFEQVQEGRRSRIAE